MTVALGAAAALIAAALMVRVAVQPATEHERVGAAHGWGPLTFVENQGQADPKVRYLAHGANHGFFLTRCSLLMSLMPQGTTTASTSGWTSPVPTKTSKWKP